MRLSSGNARAMTEAPAKTNARTTLTRLITEAVLGDHFAWAFMAKKTHQPSTTAGAIRGSWNKFFVRLGS